MSSQWNDDGTHATRPAAAAGSAIAWSRAIFGSPGHSSSSRVGVGGDRAQRGRELGVPLAEQVEQHRRPDHEHAGVPPVAAGRDVLGGGRHRRLLDELAHGRRAGVAGQLVAEVDVAERRGRERRLDTERDQPVVAGDLRPRAAPPRRTPRGRGSRGRRRTSPSRRRGPALEDRGREPDGGHRVPGRRLGEDRVRVDLGQLLEDGRRGARRPVTTTNRSSTSGASRSRVPCSRVRPLAGQVVEELRGRGAGQRPEPGASPAGRDHGPEVVDRGHAGSLGRCRRSPTS